jgi:Ca-activated chloride channel family protein
MKAMPSSNISPNGGSFPPAVGLAIFVALASAAAASPDTALKAYEKGDYRRARAEFERLAKEKPEDPRLRFNAGDAAYRQQDFTNATAHFETVLGAPDLKLQEQAYYNLGNTHYQLGAKAAEPQAKLQAWQQAVTNYSSAVKLDPRDTNALSNLNFVQRQVEELMKQMPKQPQPQNQKQDDKKQDQKDQDQDDSQQASQSKDQKDQKPKDSKDSKDSQPNQEPKSQQAQRPDQQKDSEGSKRQDQKEQAKAEQEKQQQAQQQQGQPAGEKSPGSEGQPQAAEAGKPGEMNAAQAGRMLDEQKAEEKALVFQAGGSGKEAGERQRKNRKKW